MKVCRKCKIEKQEIEFCKDSSQKDNLTRQCKACLSEYYKSTRDQKTAYQAEYRRAKKEQVKASDARYRQANKVRIAEYRQANKDRIAAIQAQYHQENRERRNAQSAEYYKANKKRRLAYHAKYRSENPEQRAANDRNRRALKRSAEGKHTASDVRDIFDAQRGMCANCHHKLFKSGKNKFHVDHIIPLAKGGSNWPDNLQCLCPACNLSKNAKDPIEWARQNGRLL